jgi:VWFA-related protein
MGRSGPWRASALTLALAGSLITHAWSPAGQVPATPPGTQAPVFRSGVQLIEVDAVATDVRGQPVLDLTRTEFEVYDEGQRQEIVFFSAVSIPVLPPHVPVLRDVATNAQAEDGRLFMLVLDDIHSRRQTTAVIKTVARRLVERLSPNDRVAVVWMSTDRKGAHEFTTNHGAALAAIDGFAAVRASVARAGGSLLPDSEVETRVMEVGGSTGGQAFFEGLRPFNMVADLCRHVASIPHRRKTIVYVGQGPTGVLLGERVDPRMNDHVYLAVFGAIQAARRANVALYVIDPGGRATPGSEGFIDDQGPPSFRDLAKLRQDTMATFGMATGGFWGTGNRAVDHVDRIVTETSNYYLLAYYPPPPTSRVLRWLKEFAGNPWARFRSIDVRTTRPGVTIRSRKGYWQDDALPDAGKVSRTEPETSVIRALSAVLPQSSLPLRALAVPVRGDVNAREHPVAIAIEVIASPRDGEAERIELFAAAVEPGEALRRTHRATAVFKPAASRRPGPRYLLCERLDLKPGRYQVRLAVQSAWAKATGSVYVDVTVPDFRNEAVSMSGIVLDQRTFGPMIPTARSNVIAPLLPALPTLERTFGRGDTVWARAEIYVARKGKATPVEVVAELRPTDGVEPVWHVREQFQVAAFGTKRKVAFQVRLPLGAVPPGSYRLGIEATAPAPDGQREAPRVRRDIDLTVGGSSAGPGSDPSAGSRQSTRCIRSSVPPDVCQS